MEFTKIVSEQEDVKMFVTIKKEEFCWAEDVANYLFNCYQKILRKNYIQLSEYGYDCLLERICEGSIYTLNYYELSIKIYYSTSDKLYHLDWMAEMGDEYTDEDEYNEYITDMLCDIENMCEY